MYKDVTILNVDMANIERGAIGGFTDLNPLFWLALQDYWVAFLFNLGWPHLNPGLMELLQPIELWGDPTDYGDMEINETPFKFVPAELQISVTALYPQLS